MPTSTRAVTTRAAEARVATRTGGTSAADAVQTAQGATSSAEYARAMVPAGRQAATANKGTVVSHGGFGDGPEQPSAQTPSLPSVSVGEWIMETEVTTVTTRTRVRGAITDTDKTTRLHGTILDCTAGHAIARQQMLEECRRGRQHAEKLEEARFNAWVTATCSALAGLTEDTRRGMMESFTTSYLPATARGPRKDVKAHAKPRRRLAGGVFDLMQQAFLTAELLLETTTPPELVEILATARSGTNIK